MERIKRFRSEIIAQNAALASSSSFAPRIPNTSTSGNAATATSTNNVGPKKRARAPKTTADSAEDGGNGGLRKRKRAGVSVGEDKSGNGNEKGGVVVVKEESGEAGEEEGVEDDLEGIPKKLKRYEDGNREDKVHGENVHDYAWQEAFSH